MARPQAAIDLLATLVGFDTTSRNSNLALIDFAEALLARHGARSFRVANQDGDKANLFASIGPDVPGGVVLSGHSDVVPVDGQDWSSDPFQLAERDGRLYGRGACDMKGFLACALALAPEIAAANLAFPIHFALSYDEEIGCRGVGAMINRVASELPAPQAVIVGEPTEMGLVNAHKGIAAYRTSIKGKAAHSSLTHLGASAVMAAGTMIGHLDAIAERYRGRADPRSPFIPAHSTLTANRIEGGTAVNILAEHCAFLWDMRFIPGDDPADVIRELDAHAATVVSKMRETAPEASIVTEPISVSPPLAPEPDGRAEALVRALTGANTATAVSYATEAGQFQRAGFSAVICGPGSINQAHQADEYVSIAELTVCTLMLRRLIVHLSAP